MAFIIQRTWAADFKRSLGIFFGGLICGSIFGAGCQSVVNAEEIDTQLVKEPSSISDTATRTSVKGAGLNVATLSAVKSAQAEYALASGKEKTVVSGVEKQRNNDFAELDHG